MIHVRVAFHLTFILPPSTAVIAGTITSFTIVPVQYFSARAQADLPAREPTPFLKGLGRIFDGCLYPEDYSAVRQMCAHIIIASDFSGIWMMLQFPVSAILGLAGIVLLFTAKRRPVFARICFAAAIMVTAGTAVCELSLGSSFFDGRHAGTLFGLASPALVSVAFLLLSLRFRTPTRRKP
jgi:hypothetical protein